ncbi:NAD(P)/FAD-dependent oxidoreductase [Nocardiopsis synnemataformans]|uniref:NAD(P)/FAD-dependent oxidoreductase n=1 Tax=Nocardiopsis synnemataformans TaxID=61305 RepID=UPI003EBBD281
MRRIVVVGASAAGLAAVETLRRQGFEGEVTLLGDEPYPPYDRPPLSKQILAADWEPDRLPLRSTADLEGLGVRIRLGVAATGLDTAARTVALSDGGHVEYDGLVVATGVRPRRLPGNSGRVLRTLDDALALRSRLAPERHLAVVGAGFLGAEVAAVARGLGCEVTMVEPAPVPLAHAVGEAVGRVLSQVHVDRGVRLRTGVGVAEVRSDGVVLDGGEVVAADEVLVAVGSTPNTEWLEGSGLKVADGLVCDSHCSAAPGVYAAGDVARWRHPLFGVSMRVEHRTHAAEQGMAAARNLLAPGGGKAFAPVPYFWSDQYDMKIQAYGYLRGHEEVAVVDGELGPDGFVAAYRRGERLTGILAVGISPRALRAWRKAVADGTPWGDVFKGVA